MDILGSANGTAGPLFWGAAAAAALGASLLMAALMLHRRRRAPARRVRRPSLGRLFRPRRKQAAPGAARAVPGGYAPAQPALAGLPGAVRGPDPAEVELLVARLRRASARLAALEAESAESRLKATPPRTDQLYRRGVG